LFHLQPATWFMNGAQASGAGVGSAPTSWSIVETGDFNGDGKSDILWQDTSGNVAIWFMNGAQASGAGVGNVPTSGRSKAPTRTDAIMPPALGSIAKRK